uniref:Astacin domain-containing protein n=1 Tax=Angiostrongylus cantonensis TaxID=6313 RepID=A0A0K0CT52_ANGCA
MRVLLLAYFVAIAGATLLDSEESSDEQSTSEHSFDEKLQEAYQLLKGDPNAYDTMELRRKVHSMKDKIIDKYMASEQPSDEKYAESVRGQTGVSAAETNMNNELGFSLFQGDIMLTKQQANEILEDIVDSDGDRKKRQAFRDENYPRTLWSNGVNYAFWNASHSARRVFLKAAEIWRENTCLEFREDSSADDVVWVVHGSSCWSHLGRVGGAQILSLGDNCDFVRSTTCFLTFTLE